MKSPIIIVRRRLKDRVERLEEASNNHQRYINSCYRQFALILNHLNVEIEELPETIRLKEKEKN